jgi:hypothetical protein
MGITNLPTKHPISLTNYSYILTTLFITLIALFLYLSYSVSIIKDAQEDNFL